MPALTMCQNGSSRCGTSCWRGEPHLLRKRGNKPSGPQFAKPDVRVEAQDTGLLQPLPHTLGSLVSLCGQPPCSVPSSAGSDAAGRAVRQGAAGSLPKTPELPHNSGALWVHMPSSLLGCSWPWTWRPASPWTCLTAAAFPADPGCCPWTCFAFLFGCRESVPLSARPLPGRPWCHVWLLARLPLPGSLPLLLPDSSTVLTCLPAVTSGFLFDKRPICFQNGKSRFYFFLNVPNNICKCK